MVVHTIRPKTQNHIIIYKIAKTQRTTKISDFISLSSLSFLWLGWMQVLNTCRVYEFHFIHYLLGYGLVSMYSLLISMSVEMVVSFFLFVGGRKSRRNIQKNIHCLDGHSFVGSRNGLTSFLSYRRGARGEPFKCWTHLDRIGDPLNPSIKATSTLSIPGHSSYSNHLNPFKSKLFVPITNLPLPLLSSLPTPTPILIPIPKQILLRPYNIRRRSDLDLNLSVSYRSFVITTLC